MGEKSPDEQIQLNDGDLHLLANLQKELIGLGLLSRHAGPVDQHDIEHPEACSSKGGKFQGEQSIIDQEQIANAVQKLRESLAWESQDWNKKTLFRLTENTRRAMDSEIRDLQTKLTALGCYEGPVDGQWTGDLSRSIEKFQRDNGLTVTGCMDPCTRKRLREKPPFTFEDVLCAELKSIEQARSELNTPSPVPHQGDDDPESIRQGYDIAIARAHQARLLGVAFSGGGIRSATFNLGVLQGLSRCGLLRYVDYLSTVSGGGYIGNWLHAWVKQENSKSTHAKPAPQPAICTIEEALAEKCPHSSGEPRQVKWLREFSNYLTPRLGIFSADTLSAAATWMRNVILNQVMLAAVGLAILTLPWFFLWWVQTAAHDSWIGTILPTILGGLAVATAAALSGWECALIETGAAFSKSGAKDSLNRRRTAKRVIVLAGFGALLFGLFLPKTLLSLPENCILRFAALLGALHAFPFFISRIWGLEFSSPSPGADSQQNPPNPAQQGIPQPVNTPVSKWVVIGRFFRRLISAFCHCPKRQFWPAVIGGIILGLLSWCWLDKTLPDNNSGLDACGWVTRLILGPGLVTLFLLLAVTVQSGVAGRGWSEAIREWWGRTGGMLFISAVIWLALSGVALLGPYALAYAGIWISSMGGIVWLVTTFGGVILGGGPSTDGSRKSSWKEWVAIAAPWVFIVGLLLLLSFGLQTSFMGINNKVHNKPKAEVTGSRIEKQQLSYQLEFELPEGPGRAKGDLSVQSAAPVYSMAEYARSASQPILESPWLLACPAGILLLAWLLSRVLDINIFSLHMFYRNRLERCYLGASNPERHTHPFMGLASNDSPKLAELRRAGDPDQPFTGPVQRPYPLINAALNISGRDDLAWQERKAGSYLFSPDYCGYQLAETTREEIVAYQKTSDYLNPCYTKNGEQTRESGWISLGMPLTVSGAAASPNSGYHTNPATAFLMTVFNVRLGWWIQNTRLNLDWHQPGPRCSMNYLFKELIPASSTRNSFVYVSDGGHFENLGIYELVRRRCRYIIACDAGCDPELRFEDLGNAIRKCNVDLGIEIDIDTSALKLLPDGWSRYHCAVGKIHYQRRDPVSAPGYLLYIKASLTGDEPTDVLQYHAEHSAFPHQSTGDQWFSESQFESYRRLGAHITDQVLAQSKLDVASSGTGITPLPSAKHASPFDLERLFQILSNLWHAPSLSGEASFTQHGQELEKIFDQLRLDRNLRFLDRQIYPAWLPMTRYCAPKPESRSAEKKSEPAEEKGESKMLPSSDGELRAGFYLCCSLIQLMENVYLDLNLEAEWDHPDNRGWVNYFRQWSLSGMFRVTWSVTAATFGARFQQFCIRQLKLADEFQGLKITPAGESIWKMTAGGKERHIISLLIHENERGVQSPAPSGIDVANLPEPYTVEVLEIQVANPHNDADVFVFPVGFALIRKREEVINNQTGEKEFRPDRLIYYHVQDYLRSMGLGRIGLRILRGKYADLSLRVPDDLIRIIPDADPAQVKALWHSVIAL